MTQAELETNNVDRDEEAERLHALTSTGILDTPPEPAFDAIARLAANYFRADCAGIAFADESRIWVKASWGRYVRELPRQNSVFELVLAEDGPIFELRGSRANSDDRQVFVLEWLDAECLAAAPIRSIEGRILGTISVIWKKSQPSMQPEELRMLESLADMVASQLELRRMRKTLAVRGIRRSHPPRFHNGGGKAWPQKSDLRHALEVRQFVLYYQPEIDLATLRIVGLEALIRWQHPERGLIPPMDFIPLAEESGLILPIGDWGLAEACRQIQTWCREDSSYESLRVCVNLSARQFSRQGLADHVESLLAQSGISSSQLGLEMTESSLIPNMHTAMEVLGSLRRLGVTLLLDDFGTGYSSLNHLHSFPFDVLKIDSSFVGRMASGEQPLQIVRTIIELARVLGMDVVAEGIETCAQYRLLRHLGCRFGQGFLFARPMSAEAVIELLRMPGRVLPAPEQPETTCRPDDEAQQECPARSICEPRI